MRLLVTILFVFAFTDLFSQKDKLSSISYSYFGEMITHPGFKLGVNYQLKHWEKDQGTKKTGETQPISKSILIGPTIGFFYHKRYQTGLFIMPEVKYKRQNQQGRFYELGVGLGYLRTFIPNTYEVNENGEVRATSAGHHYFATSYFVSFGKDLSVTKNIPVAYFIKPQFLYAVPNFPKGTGYFAFEIGMNYKLK